MVSVRPTIKVLKVLAGSGKLPNKTSMAYQCAQRATENEIKLQYLREAVAHAQMEVALVEYAQSRFDRGIFERLKAFNFPIFETRDTGGSAWRGAVIHDGGEEAWLVYADSHDHFHAEAKTVISSMRAAGTLGPSKLDLRILNLQKAVQKRQEFEKLLITETLTSIKQAVVLGEQGEIQAGSLKIALGIDTSSFDTWDVESAHDEIDILSIRITNWHDNYEELQSFTRVLQRLLRVDEGMMEAYAGPTYVLNIGISRADLIAILDIPRESLRVADFAPPPPDKLHYSTKGSLAEAYVTGNAIRAVCGKWWVPIGDDKTHGHLPICPDCERLEPYAEALRAYLRSVTDP